MSWFTFGFGDIGFFFRSQTVCIMISQHNLSGRELQPYYRDVRKRTRPALKGDPGSNAIGVVAEQRVAPFNVEKLAADLNFGPKFKAGYLGVLRELGLYGRADLLGSGGYGRVYMLPYAAGILGRERVAIVDRILNEMMTNITYSKHPPKSAAFVMKIERYDFDDDDDFVQKTNREAMLHKWVTGQSVTHCGKTYRGKDITSEFYFSGLVARLGVYVTFMSAIDGVTMYEFLKTHNGRLPAGAYKAVEHALAGLFLFRVIHTDFHLANVMISSKAPYVAKIIDFGRAAIIPDALQAFVNDRISRGDLDGAWYDPKYGLQTYADAVSRARGLRGYPANGKTLRYLKSLVETTLLTCGGVTNKRNNHSRASKKKNNTAETKRTSNSRASKKKTNTAKRTSNSRILKKTNNNNNETKNRLRHADCTIRKMVVGAGKRDFVLSPTWGCLVANGARARRLKGLKTTGVCRKGAYWNDLELAGRLPSHRCVKAAGPMGRRILAAKG